MLVYDFVPVGAPFELAARRMRTDASDAFAAAAASVFDCPEAVRSLTPSGIRNRWDTLVLDVRWAGNPLAPRFEYLEGELQLAPLRDNHSHLSLSASYEPTGSAEFTPVERLRAHRETEVGVRDVLVAVALQLEQAERRR
jgi:hypothetical protein